MNNQEKKIYEIRTPGYKVIIASGIIVIIALIVAYIKDILDITALLSTGGITACIAFATVYTDSLKRIKIHEEGIIVGEKVIQFKEIEAIELMKKDYNIGVRIRINRFKYDDGRIKDENFLQIKFKDGSVDGFFVSNYSLKQVRELVNYIEQYSKCDISQANDFLNIAENEDKKDITISTIAIIIGIIIVGILVAKISANFSNLG